jgi:hypothetical protein
MDIKFVFCGSRTSRERQNYAPTNSLIMCGVYLVLKSRLYFTFIFVTGITVHASLQHGISYASEFVQRGHWNLI